MGVVPQGVLDPNCILDPQSYTVCRLMRPQDWQRRDVKGIEPKTPHPGYVGTGRSLRYHCSGGSMVSHVVLNHADHVSNIALVLNVI